MKQFRILTMLVISLMLFSCNGNAQKEQEKPTNSKNRIEVIDFHSTHRCMTCNAIEANTQYTLDTYFKEELESGKITFQSVNVDTEDNYEMTEKFEASGTSLFLLVVIDNKEKIFNLTNFAFSKGRNKEAFSKALKIKIEKLLKKL